MVVELADCEDTLLREIADKGCFQKSVAMTYRLTMESSDRSRVDWGKVNRAIIKRWSISGLNRIKMLAHSGKAFE